MSKIQTQKYISFFKLRITKKNVLYFLGFVLMLTSIPLISHASVLYIEPIGEEYCQKDVFAVGIRIDTEEEVVNVVQVGLSFSSDILEVESLSKGNSILSLWVKEPTVLENTISFAGGIPMGYQGTDGLLIKIIFRVREINNNKLNQISFDAEVFFQKDVSVIFLNDGKGTKAELAVKETVFNISPKRLSVFENWWQREIIKDKTSPLLFNIIISRTPLIFNGKNFIIFNTTDKETGIDYYEVKEDGENWRRASSPYVLKNQHMVGEILVRAVDMAENKRVVRYNPVLKKPFAELQ